jgi:geranylgeranyl diphosphate synthase, type II
MQTAQRIERALQTALRNGACRGGPPALGRALHYAVLPGGARIRPKLSLAVARALGDPMPGRSDGVAAAIELLHCASLAHDDLPCFDDAPTRRGRPSLHRAFGEALAVLAGDALIVMAFESLARGCAGSLARGCAESPARGCADPREVADARQAADSAGVLVRLVTVLGAAVGAPHGLCAGQAWELEPQPDLGRYHRAKTGALFAAATAAGAEAAGHPGDPWRRLGECLGEAYQVADDLKDVACCAAELGKPVGQDAALGRPNAVSELGAGPALRRLRVLVEEALAAVPDVPGAAGLRQHIMAETERLVPVQLSSRVA